MPPLLQDGPGLIQHDDNACSMDDIEDFKKAMGKSYQQSSANKDMIPEDLGGLDYSDDEHKGSNVASVSKGSKNDKDMNGSEEEKRFTKKEGVLYLTEDNYTGDIPRQNIDYHIVIALSAAELGIRRGDTTAKGSSVDVIYPSKRPLLPYRIRIANELLMDELDQHCGFHCDHDHVAPFRTLVLYEQELRQSHRLREFEFAEISRNFPSHSAVLRKEIHLPGYYIYLSNDDKTVVVDSIERSRFLLDGLRVLMRVFDTELKDLLAAVRKLRAAPLGNPTSALRLPFPYLWYLFTPGEEIVSLKPSPQVYRVLQATGGRNSIIPRKSANGNSKRTVSDLIVDCFSLDFNGKEFGAKPNVFNIRPYDDHIPVPELPVFPLKFLDQNIRDELFERGHKFVELVEPGHRRYQGLSLKEGDRFDVYEEIDSDVIVDFQLAFQNSEAKISPPLFGGGVITNPTAEDDEETRTDGWTYDDPELLMLRWQKFSHATELLRNQTPSFLSKDSYVLLPYRVYGYVLLSRKWLPLHIDLTKKVPEIKPGENDNFRKLVLPEGHKDIVRALVSAHARQRSLLINSDKANRVNRDIDIVKGKGKGLIILLHGAPGVGKTSTAECVAANAGRPLLPITCGDLGGISAKEVEQNLENFFDLARKWNCVLLLDEADVFLSTRDGGDIRQTSLVSVFLRVLEYYSGILILTTNRVGSFDEAIKSRVHCALYYPPLDQKQSLKIWKMNLATLEERNKEPDSSMSVRFNRKEIEEYARKHWKSTSKGTRWNGRQIKNAFQTAIALADWDHVESTGGNLHPDGPLLKVEHFKKVAQASAHFDNYLIKVRKTDEQRAREHDIRRDDVGFDPDEEPTKRAPGKTKLLKSKSGRTATTSSEPSEDGSEEETEDEDASDFQSDSVEEEEKEITRSPSPPPKKKNSKKKRERE